MVCKSKSCSNLHQKTTSMFQCLPPASASTLNQHLNNVDHKGLSTLSQRWYLIEIKVELTYIYRCCFNIGKTTSKKLRWFNVGEPTLFQLKFGWKWKLSQCIFTDVVSTLAEQRWNSIEIVPSIQYRWPNVVSILIFGLKWKLS